MRLRRRRYFLLRVADEPVLDIARFLRGIVELRNAPECTLLCPVRGESLRLTAAELALTMTVPADRWLLAGELQGMDGEAQARLLDLARRGILLSDPAPQELDDLADGEQVLKEMQWHDLAAVYHAHSRWQRVDQREALQKLADGGHKAGFEELRRRHGEPPPHFVRRDDARQRIPLRIPMLDGPFFAALLARRTTRAYLCQRPLPMSALELMLYAVFGTQGIKQLAKGLSAIKRTSPSAGALHPIEAYVLALNVQDLPSGLYHYETGTHALAQLEAMETPAARDLAREFTAGQAYFAEAHALVVHVARFDRNFWKYARHRKAFKTVLMDSAHLSQTFYLTAAHLGLGAFYTAAINDVDIERRLRLTPLREGAIGINGVGLSDTGRDELHFLPDPHFPAGVA